MGGYHYRWVDVAFDRAARVATITVTGPAEGGPRTLDDIRASGAQWWPLAMARELDDAILMLRINELEIGTLLLKTRGSVAALLDSDAAMLAHQRDWFVRETIAFLAADPGTDRRLRAQLLRHHRSGFVLCRDAPGTGAGRRSLLHAGAARGRQRSTAPALSAANLGPFLMVNGMTRLATRFAGEDAPLAAITSHIGEHLDAAQAMELGLVTFTPDDLDWEDEIRLAVEERASLSPDALTGLEASLRFPGPETMETRIFSRLSAWQNWIFNRPNAVGEKGALKLFGSGSKPHFNWERV